MSFLKVALGCALVLPFSAIACGGTEGEPDVADGSHRDAGEHSQPKAEAGRAADTGRHVIVHVDAGPETAAPADAPPGLDAPAKPEAAPPRDHGEASTTYPAFTPFMPQVQYGGGAVLSNAQIVTITWPGDTNAAIYEAFGDDIGSSDYWMETTSEYKVGPAFSGPANHLRLPASEAPIASWADVDIETWVSDHATNYTMYGWPAPGNNVVYTLYISPQTDVTLGGTSACQQGVGGYHGNVAVDGQDVAYAVVLQCQGAAPATRPLPLRTSSSRPRPIPTPRTSRPGPASTPTISRGMSSRASRTRSPTRASSTSTPSSTRPSPWCRRPCSAVMEAWRPVTRGCLLRRRRHHPVCGPADLVQRQRGRRPRALQAHRLHGLLQRVAAQARPVGGDQPVVARRPGEPAGAGISDRQGGDAHVPHRLRERWPHHPGPWTISAVEGNPLLGPNGASHLTISIDNNVGQNGDIGYVTVTVNAIDTSMNGELITIEVRSLLPASTGRSCRS